MTSHPATATASERLSPRLRAACVALALVASPSPAAADMWCAWPLVVHEWGVHVLGPDGAPAASERLPSWFHTTIGGPSPSVAPVSSMPADNGVRKLPVVHFYAPQGITESIPLGLEVGFARGAASAWYPQVDRFRSAAAAHSPEAVIARGALAVARAARSPWGGGPPLATDPTRQLAWDRLELTRAPTAATAPSGRTGIAWVDAARALPALWVNRGAESERFAFYEGDTSESTPLALRRAAGFTTTRRAYELENRGAHPVHDVFVVVREGDQTFVPFVAELAPGARWAFVLEDARVDGAALAAATSDRLRARLVDPASPDGPAAPGAAECVTGRDPAIPFERAHGHALYRGEVDVLLSAWAERFFERPGARILYREDEDALDEALPLSIYTSMWTTVVLERAGLALWQLDHLP